MSTPTVTFVSLGCPKNLVDSEKMLGMLAEAGCGVVGGGGRADVMVVNTCGFLAASRDEAIGILQEAAGQKRRGQIKRIVVAGCLVQRDGQTLLERVPEIDALVGVNNRADIVRAVVGGKGNKSKSRKVEKSKSDGARTLFLGEYHSQSWSDRTRLRLTPRHYAYLRMSEGCNQKCTFCTIPSIRGLMYCKPVDEILAEARELIDDGVREINLLGQDTTSYRSAAPSVGENAECGMRNAESPEAPRRAYSHSAFHMKFTRLGGHSAFDINLAGLLRILNSLDGVRWIRLMYAYPSDFTDEMIDAIAECERVVKYIDIPLQHINDRMLKAMHRRVTRKQTESLLAKLRERVPGISIRTTFIAGFPGETDAEFDELRRFVADFGFDMLGVFPYSLEPETPAGRMKDQNAESLKQERAALLMETQQRVAFQRAAAMKGRTIEVMIDGFGKDGVYPARHAGQAPEIDSNVQVHGGEFDPGDFVKVRVTGGKGYDLIAKPAGVGLPILR